MKEEYNIITGIIIGTILITMIVMCAIFAIIEINYDIVLDQETSNDVCKQLTGNSTAVASSDYFKLICTIPSFDSTQNIIVKTNNK